MSGQLTIQDLWVSAGFNPNDEQRRAILHVNGPLFLPAGPGSGKTRVLLWRTLNLIVFHGVKPEQIFLSTFTEKAARQLRDGISTMLGDVQSRTGKSFDIGRMYVGTIHSLCQKLIRDRRFYPPDEVANLPALLDDLGQFFFVQEQWDELVRAAGFTGTDLEIQTEINQELGTTSASKFESISNVKNFFNRCSEENMDVTEAMPRAHTDTLKRLLMMYMEYQRLLSFHKRVDFSSLQMRAHELLQQSPKAGSAFQYVIIDEYQDTNPIQEQIFFELAREHKNICVVGDDDQALYRFRGATVENFVHFAARCQQTLRMPVEQIPLITNYRSHHHVVTTYNRYMGDDGFWQVAGRMWRVRKTIKAHDPTEQRHRSVVATQPGDPQQVSAQVAQLARRLIDEGKVKDANQIAVLFPSVQYRGKINDRVKAMRTAFEAVGLKVYAPRAGRFLEVDEAVDFFGVLMHIIGKPTVDPAMRRGDFADYLDWCDAVYRRGEALINSDPVMAKYVKMRQDQIQQRVSDYLLMRSALEQNHISQDMPYDPDDQRGPNIRQVLLQSGASAAATRALGGVRFDRMARYRVQQGQPFVANQLVARATTFDYGVLDVFYQLLGFNHFRSMLELAEGCGDEGPTFNLSMISQYISRFLESQRSALFSARDFNHESLARRFWLRFIYVLYRNGESEYEDKEMMFPRGRVPFLTIHQSKGLEFPVVILGNTNKNDSVQPMEKIMRQLIDREREPDSHSARYDTYRLFYVALSRAKNLCVITAYGGHGKQMHDSMRTLLGQNRDIIQTLPVDLGAMPIAKENEDPIPKRYSFTSDYATYLTCARQYMLFRKYEFAPSRTPYQMFGSLIHKTIDEIHNRLITMREGE